MTAYRKLSRKKRTLSGASQLWLGDDHLLVVRSTHFTEEYRRFQLEDIQAIVASSAGRTMTGTVLGILGLAAISLSATSTLPFFRIFGAVCGTLGIGALVYDLLRGARVRCKLLTEVSTEVLSPITRLSDYHRLMQTLGPAIEAVQGALAAEAAASAKYTGRAYLKPEEEPPGAMRFLPHTLYACVAINAAAMAGFHFWRKEEFLQAAGSLLIGEIVLSVIVWIRASRLKIEGAMKGLLTLTALLLVLDAASAIGQFSFLVYSVAEAGRQGRKPPLFWDLPWIPLAGKASVLWRAAVAPVALALLWLSRPKVVRAAPEEPAAQENPPSQD